MILSKKPNKNQHNYPRLDKPIHPWYKSRLMKKPYIPWYKYPSLDKPVNAWYNNKTRPEWLALVEVATELIREGYPIDKRPSPLRRA